MSIFKPQALSGGGQTSKPSALSPSYAPSSAPSSYSQPQGQGSGGGQGPSAHGAWGPGCLPRYRLPLSLGTIDTSRTMRAGWGAGWLQFSGQHSGWTVQWDPNTVALTIYPGDVIPVPPSGTLTFVAGTGSINLRLWDEETGAVIAGTPNGSSSGSASTSGLGATATPTVAGSPATYTGAATTKSLMIKAKASNGTAGIFIGKTSSDVAANGTKGVELQAGDWVVWPGATFGYAGNASDTFYVQEFQ